MPDRALSEASTSAPGKALSAKSERVLAEAREKLEKLQRKLDKAQQFRPIASVGAAPGGFVPKIVKTPTTFSVSGPCGHPKAGGCGEPPAC